MEKLVLLILAVSAFAEEKVEEITIGVGEAKSLKTSKYPESEDLGKIVWKLSTEPGANIKLVCDDLRIAPTDIEVSEEQVEQRCSKGYVRIEGHADEPKVKSKICDSAYDLIARSKDNKMTVEFNLIEALGLMDCKAKAYKGEDTDNDAIDYSVSIDENHSDSSDSSDSSHSSSSSKESKSN